jgi:hypothetical protein
VLTFWLTVGFCSLALLLLFSGFAPELQNTAATLVFDIFAVFVQTKMLSALNCNYSHDPSLLIATQTTSDPLVCWEGMHLLYGGIAFIAIPVFNISSVFVKFRTQSRQSVVTYDLWFVAVQQQLLLLAATIRTFFGDHSPYVLLATLILCSSTMLSLALFYNKPICNVALLIHCNRTFWAMAWWTSAMAFVSEWVLSLSAFTLFFAFYVGLMAIIAISCIKWCQWGPSAASAPLDRNSVSFFGVKRYLKQIETENVGVAVGAPTTLREPLLLSPSTSPTAPTTSTPPTQRTIEILIPPKTDQRCIEASTMHIVVDHLQEHCQQGNATYKLGLENVGLEAGSLEPLATFLVGYLQFKGCRCMISKSSEVAMLCSGVGECCINPHWFICFCCFPKKPQDSQKGLCNCLQCVSKYMPTCPITSLSLASNELGSKPKTLKLIGSILKSSHLLTDVNVSDNKIGAEGARLIADGVCE